MNGRCLRRNNWSKVGEVSTECGVNMSTQQFKLGDIIWCKISGRSWWPVQVVDDKFAALKPKKRKKDQFLVRLYGTFEHIYVEPGNCVPKNEKVHGQENSSIREIFEKALVEELSRLKSGVRAETKISESNENARERDEVPKGKGQRKGKLKKTMIDENAALADFFDYPKATKSVKMVTSGRRQRPQKERFKGRTDEKNGMESAVETQNLNSGRSTIGSLDKLDSNVNCKAPDSNYKLNPDGCTNDEMEISDTKYIKKIVAKIVKEVAAENERNEALKSKEMESYLASSEYIETSRKISYEIANMKRDIQKRVENHGMDLGITGAIDETPESNAGPSDAENINGADQLSLKEQDFDSDNKDTANDTGADSFKSMLAYETQETDFVLPYPSKKLNVNKRKMEAMKHNETVVTVTGDQRGKVVKVVSRKKMHRAGSKRGRKKRAHGRPESCKALA